MMKIDKTIGDKYNIYKLEIDNIISTINVKVEVLESFNFNINFHQEELRYNFLERHSDENLIKLREKNIPLTEKIKILKRLNFLSSHLMKLFVYRAEITLSRFNKKKSDRNKKGIHISLYDYHFPIMGNGFKGFQYLIIFAILDELNKGYTKNGTLQVKKLTEYLKDTSTKYVVYKPHIDERLTEIFYDIDDEAYEKGRQYQWLV